jgi:hypothetical protein
MARSGKRARRLVVDGEAFRWRLGHSHHRTDSGGYEGCAEILFIRRSDRSA